MRAGPRDPAIAQKPSVFTPFRSGVPFRAKRVLGPIRFRGTGQGLPCVSESLMLGSGDGFCYAPGATGAIFRRAYAPVVNLQGIGANWELMPGGSGDLPQKAPFCRDPRAARP